MNVSTLPYLVGNEGIFIDGDWVESKDQDAAGDVRLIQLADIGIGEYLNKSARFMTSQKAAELKCTYLRPGDILIARMPDPIGRACIFPGDPKPCVTVVDVCILRVSPKIADPKWVLHYLNSAIFQRKISPWVKGATRQRISRGNLGAIEFKLPLLAEQKRISAILDKADAIRRKRQQAIQLADEFLRSVFLEMFGDPLTNPKNWETKTIGELGRVITGSTPPSSKEGMFGADVPFVTPGDLDSNLSIVDRWLTPAGASNSRLCRQGSLMACCIGATIGKVAFAKRESAFNQQINSVEWYDKIDDRYGFFVFKLRPTLITRNAIKPTLPILKKSLFEEIKIPVPTKSLQEEFSNLHKSVESIQAKQASALEFPLFASLSQMAFAGNLYQ